MGKKLKGSGFKKGQSGSRAFNAPTKKSVHEKRLKRLEKKDEINR